jgi:hypothetical protein
MSLKEENGCSDNLHVVLYHMYTPTTRPLKTRTVLGAHPTGVRRDTHGVQHTVFRSWNSTTPLSLRKEPVKNTGSNHTFMKRKEGFSNIVIIVVILLTGLGFAGYFMFVRKTEGPQPSRQPPSPITQVPKVSELEVLSKLDISLLERLARGVVPDTNGAMGRNKNGYFHVRFQLGFSETVAYGLMKEDPVMVEYGVRAMEYAFRHQNADGTFQLIVPEDLKAQISSDPQTVEATQASGVAFFYSDVGRALLLVRESQWFETSKDTVNLRSRIEKLGPRIAKSLTKLADQAPILEKADLRDTNRLFFDASAYYLVGSWLNNQRAINLGLDFMNKGIAQQRADGVFIEKGGHDSSYQLTSLGRIFYIYLHLQPQEEHLRVQLWQVLSKGLAWEASRVLPTGEISTKGNTRVYPGGEQFLGHEKGVDPKGAVVGFEYYRAMTGDTRYSQLVDKILKYYNK